MAASSKLFLALTWPRLRQPPPAGSEKKMKWILHTYFGDDRFVPTRFDVIPTAGGELDGTRSGGTPH